MNPPPLDQAELLRDPHARTDAPPVSAAAARVRPSRRGLLALGPAFIAAVAYVDPGNLATNVSAGTKYGPMLLWVVVVASAMAMLVQYLSAKLGIATGANLPELCRARSRRGLRLLLWAQAESVVIMTDLAEFVGGAVALHLLFGIRLFTGGLLMAVLTFGLLALRLRGMAVFPAVVVALLVVVVVGLAVLCLKTAPSPGHVATGLRFRVQGADSLYLAAGIVGATVMPHVIYLHSGLTQGQAGRLALSGRRLLAWCRGDVLVAMTLAAVANAAILVAAAGIRVPGGLDLEQAHDVFGRVAGPAAALVFAVALLASSLASSLVGVYSGQVIMQGFLRRGVPILLRRLVCTVPPLVVLGLGVDATSALVLSQVVLAFGIPFAVVPLVVFTSDRELMGELVNRRATTLAAGAVVAVIIALNAFLLVQLVR